MAEKILITDTAEMTIRRKSDGHFAAFSTMQLAGLSQSITEERLKGGIGNKTVALLRSDKEMSLTAREALWSPEFLAMTQGASITSGTSTIIYSEKVNVVDGAATPTRTPIGDVTYTNDAGDQVTGTAGVEGAVTVTATTGDTWIYYETEVTGDTVEFNATEFSEAYEVQLHTIGYNPSSMKVVADIYFSFPHVVPSGSFDMSFENGSPMTPELEMTVMNPDGSDVMGQLTIVNRA